MGLCLVLFRRNSTISCIFLKSIKKSQQKLKKLQKKFNDVHIRICSCFVTNKVVSKVLTSWTFDYAKCTQIYA